MNFLAACLYLPASRHDRPDAILSRNVADGIPFTSGVCSAFVMKLFT